MQATLEALGEEMARDPAIFVMGEGIGKRGGNFRTTAGLYDLYGPVRLCDTPICERGFVGLALRGGHDRARRPVIDFMFADFVLDGVGEIINQIAKIQYMSSGRLKMPVVLRGCIGIGHSAATHHSGNYYPDVRPVSRACAWSCRRPRAMPRDCSSGRCGATIRCSSSSIARSSALKGPVPEEDDVIEFGQAAVVREGTDVTVVALALMVHHALKVCDELAGEGISVELIDPRTVSPLDIETILPIGGQDRPAADRGRGVRPLRHRRRRSRPSLPTAGSTTSTRRSAGSMAPARPRRTARRWRPPSSLTPTTSPRRSATWPPSEPASARETHSWPSRSPSPGWAGTWTRGSSSPGSRTTASSSRPASPSSASRATRPCRRSRAWIPAACRSHPTGPSPGETVAVGTVIGVSAPA